MLYTELLELCFYYKGETISPPQFDNDNHAQELWFAEKMICECLPDLVEDNNPRLSMAEAVALYVGKWDPYGQFEVMDTYLKNCPDLKSKVI